MDIIAEKYFYSENKKFWDNKLEGVGKRLEASSQALQELTEDERKQVQEELVTLVDRLLSDALPLPEKFCTIINPIKYDEFRKLTQEIIAFAEDRIVNLQIFTIGFTGCISFAGAELSCYPEQMDMLRKLNVVADEVHIAPSCDTGAGTPTDIDAGVRIEFWFNFFHQVELE